MTDIRRLLPVLGLLGLALASCADRPRGGGESWSIDHGSDGVDAGVPVEPRQVESASVAWLVGGVYDSRIIKVNLVPPAECVVLHLRRQVGGAADEGYRNVRVTRGWSLFLSRLVGAACSDVEYGSDTGTSASSARGEIVFQGHRPYVDRVELRLVFSPDEVDAGLRAYRIELSEEDVTVR